MSRDLLRGADRGSLAGHLLYDSYDPEGGVFVHRDGSLAVAWTIGMFDAELSGPEELASLADRFADFFRHLPPGAAAQFILSASRDIEEPLARFERSATGDSPLAPLFRAHGETLARSELFHGGTPFVGRTLRLLFTLRVFPHLGSEEATLRENYLREKSKLLAHAQSAETFFGRQGLRCRRESAEHIVRFLYRTLNPRRAKDTAPRSFRDHLPIRDQVVRSPVRFDYDRGLIHLDGINLKVLSMVQLPAETQPGVLSRTSPGAAGVLDLLPEATLVFNLGVLDDAQMRRKLEKRDAFAWRQLQGPRKRLEVLKIKEEAETALDELSSGRRTLGVRFHVILSDPDSERVSEKARAAIGAIDRMGIEMVEEDALGLQILLHALPMMYDPASDRGLKRAATMLATNVSDLLPIYGSFQGTPTPEVLLQNRKGELITFSLFDSDVAPHAVVTGVSGAGKSFFVNYLLASAARRGGHVWILDKGASYSNLCELLGGQSVVFDPDRPLRINPFGRAEDMTKERLLLAKDLLAEMAAQGEEPVRKEERAVIESAILRAAKDRGHGELFLSDVHRALQGEARHSPRSLVPALDRLVLSLQPFVGDGAYSGFFDGPSEIDFSRTFTVFEMGEIAKRRELAPSLLMAMLSNIAAFCSAPRNLPLRKYLVVDEAWSLLQSPATARFLEEALRTYRKYQAAAVLITQQVSDFAGAAGTAIRANAPNRIFLRQTSETVLAMEQLFRLSPQVKEAVSSLVTAKGKFSELLIETPTASGVARLVPSPELYAAFSTDGPDRVKLLGLVEELKRAGSKDPLLEAVRQIARPGFHRDKTERDILQPWDTC